MPSDKELFDSLLDKLYKIVVGRDDINNLDPAGGSFVSFCLPGIPLAAEDLNFSFVDMGKAELAADFSSLVNTVPQPIGRWMPSDRKVIAYYQRVLDEAVRPVVQLSDQEKKRLEAAYAILIRQVDAVDLTTGATKKVPADTPLYEAYQERSADYLAALSAYKSLQSNYLQRPNDPKAQADWFALGPVSRGNVKLKYDRWVAGGKNIIENAIQAISELGRGSGERWESLKEQLRNSKQQTPDGGWYYYTKFFPQSFWDDAHTSAWTKFSMSHEEVHTVDESSSTNWGGGGSASFGLWSVGASASYAEQKQHFKSDGNAEGIEVELIKVPLRRSWWDPTLFWDRGWKFDPNITNITLSDGQVPPTGEMTSYPTAMLIARNLKLSVNMTSEENSHVATQFSASGSVGYGPFSLRGNYSRNTDKKTHDFVRNAAGIECSGMQIIGFVCQLLPKSPNPDPTLRWQN
jgi:hypothetical protein